MTKCAFSAFPGSGPRGGLGGPECQHFHKALQGNSNITKLLLLHQHPAGCGSPVSSPWFHSPLRLPGQLSWEERPLSLLCSQPAWGHPHTHMTPQARQDPVPSLQLWPAVALVSLSPCKAVVIQQHTVLFVCRCFQKEEGNHRGGPVQQPVLPLADCHRRASLLQLVSACVQVGVWAKAST